MFISLDGSCMANELLFELMVSAIIDVFLCVIVVADLRDL